jgi:PTS system fructose-specific IIC component
LLLGGMMAVDMGGPVNKVAYTFAVGLLTTDIYAPMAAVMAAGMTPPLGLALATFVSKKYFNQAEQEAGQSGLCAGHLLYYRRGDSLCGQRPAADLPACIRWVGGSRRRCRWLFNCTLRAPHGGVFVLAIPNAVENVGLYIVAIAVGTLVTALAAIQLKHFFPRRETAKAEVEA